MKKLNAILLAFLVVVAACATNDRLSEVESESTEAVAEAEVVTAVDSVEPSLELESEYELGLDWRKTANCTANFLGLSGMAVAAAAAVALATAVVLEIASGAGAGTALNAAWADFVAIVGGGGIRSAGDVGAAIALLVERFGTLRNVLTGIGTTAAALGITQAAKDILDAALKILDDYVTGWSNYKKCCLDNDNSACAYMPFNKF